jgi:hypothetical protein
VTLKSCSVSWEDENGHRHSLDVTAETLYEAVAQALAAFRNDGWLGEIGLGRVELPTIGLGNVGQGLYLSRIKHLHGGFRCHIREKSSHSAVICQRNCQRSAPGLQGAQMARRTGVGEPWRQLCLRDSNIVRESFQFSMRDVGSDHSDFGVRS